MTWTDYVTHFEHILQSESPAPPYDNDDYFQYTKLNHTRMNRWLKHGELLPELKTQIENTSAPQQWLLITEPWCGDAAHSVPFIYLLSQLSDKITLEIELRDSGSQIDKYLTNGKSKSIPILVVRDETGKDLAVWGPRPAECQKVYDEVHAQNLDFEALKIALQNWYNKDQGKSLQEELLRLLK